jgi:hypothetical protein
MENVESPHYMNVYHLALFIAHNTFRHCISVHSTFPFPRHVSAVLDKRVKIECIRVHVVPEYTTYGIYYQISDVSTSGLVDRHVVSAIG